MIERYWNDGSSAAKQPRVLHGIERVVLLVSVVYCCENRHMIRAHDEIVLQLFPSQAMIPFLLLHRTGFTRELVDTCTAFCRRGINFYNMESLIVERRWESYARQQDLLEIHGKMSSQSLNIDDFWSSSVSKSPSNDVLAKCFLAGFLQYEQHYMREMMCIPIGESISFDHTFKVAANIGYLREDSQWIPEYGGLFIVLNEKGQVLTWQLTNGTSFANIKTLLQDLAERAQHPIKTVYVDEFCKLRGKITTVFGPNVSVKLDLFHAVQRITKTLSRKHALANQCIQELRLVFRCDGDSGVNRLSATPSPDTIHAKLTTFTAKWSDVIDEKGVKMFKQTL